MGTGNWGTDGRRVHRWEWRRAWLLLLPLASCLFPISPSAQTVVDVLVRQRRDARVQEVMAEVGDRVPARPSLVAEPDDPVIRSFLAVQARRQAVRDSLVRADQRAADSLIWAARLATLRWQKVDPDEQGDFLDRYRETYWQAANPRPGVAIDTVGTAALRGRLQAAFGDPTRNADAKRRYGYGGSAFVQFEYWFIVNDSIPVLALDLDGPFGRGLLVAGSEDHAQLLGDLKRDLSRQLLAERRPDPWVDYYHSYDRQAWYRTGYNGTDAFTREIRAPRWSGRADADRWIIHR